jgi:hypothetical protein
MTPALPAVGLVQVQKVCVRLDHFAIPDKQ